MSDNDRIRSRASDLEWKHTPDSIKDEIRRELRAEGYSDREITDMELGKWRGGEK